MERSSFGRLRSPSVAFGRLRLTQDDISYDRVLGTANPCVILTERAKNRVLGAANPCVILTERAKNRVLGAANPCVILTERAKTNWRWIALD